MSNLKSLIRAIPDFPKEGIIFRDITPLLQDRKAFCQAIDSFQRELSGSPVDKIVAIESRGFIFGGALAFKYGAGFVPVRKTGKLPWEKIQAEYDLEYGTDILEVHRDGILSGDKVIVVDDLLATGGTASATCQLVERCGGRVDKLLFLVELDELGGRKKLEGYDVFSLLHF